MKIKASTLVEVELSEEEQKKLTLAYLYKIYNWKEGYHISDENVYQTVTMHGHDAWNDEVFVRYATDDDYVVGSLLCKLKKKSYIVL